VTIADILSSSINVISHAGVVEAKRRGWKWAGAAHSTNQG